MLSLEWPPDRVRCFGSFAELRELGVSNVNFARLESNETVLTGIEPSYHSDFIDWNFGKLSAMREIYLAIEGGYRYYYMGKERCSTGSRLRFAKILCRRLLHPLLHKNAV